VIDLVIHLVGSLRVAPGIPRTPRLRTPVRNGIPCGTKMIKDALALRRAIAAPFAVPSSGDASAVVVVLRPVGDDDAGVREDPEDVDVEALAADPAVEVSMYPSGRG
jgi:hypothetical protein